MKLLFCHISVIALLLFCGCASYTSVVPPNPPVSVPPSPTAQAIPVRALGIPAEQIAQFSTNYIYARWTNTMVEPNWGTGVIFTTDLTIPHNQWPLVYMGWEQATGCCLIVSTSSTGFWMPFNQLGTNINRL